MFKKPSLTTVCVVLAIILTAGILAACVLIAGVDAQNQADCEAKGGKWVTEVTGYVLVKNVMTPIYDGHCETAK